MGAAGAAREGVGAHLFAHLIPYHDSCLEQCRRGLGERAVERAANDGAREDLFDAVAYAMAEKAAAAAAPPRDDVPLTRRRAQSDQQRHRRQAGDLSATAEGHVEHIVSKLSFTSRAQIAAWVARRRNESLGYAALRIRAT